MLDFPNSPTVGSSYQGYTWDGGKWTIPGVGGYLPTTGGTLTGPLILAADPVVPLGASTKQYVDNNLPLASITLPVINGAAAIGVATRWARSDHVHPVDTSRYAAVNPSGYQTAAQVTAVLPVASSTLPIVNSVAAVGVGTTWARADHVHQTDTTRLGTANNLSELTASAATARTNLGLTAMAILATAAQGSIVFMGAGGPTTIAPGTAGYTFQTNGPAANPTWVPSVAGAPLGSATPLMDGVATVGVSAFTSHDDHVHPTDTSRYAATNPSGFQTAAQVTAVIPTASATTPVMNGTGAVGVATTWSRGDHVHPSDTSRAPIVSPTFTTSAAVTGTFAATGNISTSGGSVSANTGITTATGNIVATAGAISAPVGNIAGASLTAGANAAVIPTIQINGTTAGDRQLVYYTAGSTRWVVGVTGTAESGSNAGSNYFINRCTDAGAFIDQPLLIARSTGIVTLSTTNLVVADPVNSAAANTLVVQNLGTSGVGIQLTGNGATTPSKYLNVVNGQFRIVNSAYNNVPLTLTDAGFLTTLAGITASSGNITATNGNVSAGGAVSAGANILATLGVYGTAGVYGDNTGQLGLAYSGNKRFLHYSGPSGYQDALDISTGYRNWISFDGTTVQMTLAFNGDLTIAGGTATKGGGGAWAAPSDARIKDVLDSYDAGLDDICALRPVRYRYKHNTDEPGVEQHRVDTDLYYIGLVAQQAEVVMPELVTETDGWIDGEAVDDLRVLDPSAITFALINAVRELSARVVALEGAAHATSA